jgi:TonB family protein
MRNLARRKEQIHLSTDPIQSDKSGLPKAGVISLFLHVALVVILVLSTRSTITKVGSSVYRVTIRPFSPQGNGTRLGSSIPGLPGRPVGLPTSLPSEKLKLIGNHNGSEKVEKRVEKSERREKLEKRKGSRKALQEAIEDIHKKVALDEIQKRVARRERLEKGQTQEPSTSHLSQEPIVSGSRTGTGLGTGTGSGTVGSPTGGSPWGSSFGGSSALESKLNDYYDTIWAKIKKEWTLPENLSKGGKSLEAIIVVIVEREGKIQKSWFEKRSGNALYDQMAMRAIKKAEPLPPIPIEFSDNTFEIGIRFHPD